MLAEHHILCIQKLDFVSLCNLQGREIAAKAIKEWVGEIAQWLMLAALTEALNSVSRTHVRGLNHL